MLLQLCLGLQSLLDALFKSKIDSIALSLKVIQSLNQEAVNDAPQVDG